MTPQEFWPFLHDIAYFGRAVFYAWAWCTFGTLLMHVIDEGFGDVKEAFIECVRVSFFMTGFLAVFALAAFTVIGTGIDLWEYVSTWLY